MIAVDLFAGAGGFTLAAERAGCRVVWAANHWPVAIASHKANHPHVEHVCQDLHQADWSQVPQHDILLGSPQCTGHARARGRDRPHHDKARSTAWAVVSAAEVCRPPIVVVENVPEFRQWDGRPSRERPQAQEYGNMFACWCMAMHALGYSRAEYIIDAADCGVPQHRVRLFCVFTRSRSPIQLRLERRPHRSARDVVDFDVGRWSSIRNRRRPLVPKILAQIEAGRAAHGDRFLVPYYGASRGGRSLDRPIGTLTTVDRYGIVDGDRYRMLSLDEARAAMGFPPGYVLAPTKRDSMRLLGNAVAGAEVLLRAIKEAA